MSSVLRILNVPKDVPMGDPEVQHEVASSHNDLSIAALGGTDAFTDDEESESLVANENRPVSGPVAPNFQGLTKRAVLEQSAAKGIKVSVEGSGLARKQMPAAGKVLVEGESVRVVFSR